MFAEVRKFLGKFLNRSAASAPDMILASAAFFILGISVASVFLKNYFENFYFYLLSVFCFLLLILFCRKKLIRLIFLCFLFLILGVWRFNYSLPSGGSLEHIRNYNGQTIELVGVVSDEPDKGSDHYKLTLKVNSLQNYKLTTNSTKESEDLNFCGIRRDFVGSYTNCPDDTSGHVQGLVLLKAPLYPEYKYGDKLKVTCKIAAPQKFASPAGEFDYAAYLARYDIYSVCNFPKEIKLIASGQGNRFYSAVYVLKNKFSEIGGKILPEPHASFLAALVYGARQGIPEDLTEQFNRTALTHIIAISGYNISLVVAILFPIFTFMFLPRRWAFPFVVLGIVFFVIFAGVSASVARAGIMGIIAAMANNTSRMSQSGRILVFVGFLMLFLNPKLLFFDRGFSLSFVATAGLIYLAPIVKNYFLWWKKGFYFRKIVEETLSATAATLPLTIYYFDRISLVSLLANLLVLPMIPLVMLFGFIALVGGLVWQSLGFVLAVIPWILINYIFKIIDFLASFRLSSVDLGNVPWFAPVILYGVLVGWMIWVKRPKREVVKVDKEVEEYEIIEE